MPATYSEIKAAIRNTSRAAVQAYCANHASFDSSHFVDSYVDTFNYRQNIDEYLIDEYLADAEPGDVDFPRVTRHSMLEEMLESYWIEKTGTRAKRMDRILEEMHGHYGIAKTGTRSDNNVEYHLFRSDV